MFEFLKRKINRGDSFGKYEFPDILLKLKEYQYSEKADWIELNFSIDFDCRYSCTPLDVIPFANADSNGIHYGFLTDFNTIDHLSNAAIVCVAPTYDPSINIISENIQEFMSMCLTVQDSILLADNYKDDLEFNKVAEGWFEDDKLKDRRVIPSKTLREEFSATKIRSPIKRINEIRSRRARLIGAETKDGIGIILQGKQDVTEFKYVRDPKVVNGFLSNVNRNSRLVFYRNSTYEYTLNDKYDKGIKKVIIKHLKKDGFLREAKILKDNY